MQGGGRKDGAGRQQICRMIHTHEYALKVFVTVYARM